MNEVEINVLPTFKRVAKELSKKYPSFREDFEGLLNNLKDNPMLGSDLGHGFRKVRMAIESKGKGKSGGARVITYIISENQNKINLLYMYDKSFRSTIKPKELKELLNKNGL